jgi:hypothetical protein
MENKTMYNNVHNPASAKIADISRSELLAKTLKSGDMVICVPYYYNENAEISRMSLETIEHIDSDGQFCTVKSADNDRRTIPLNYVLARFNAQSENSAFGYNSMELLFLADEREALSLLNEARTEYLTIMNCGAIFLSAFVKSV